MEHRKVTSAGGVVVRRGASGLEVLLGEQRDRNTDRLATRLPKGRVEPGERLEDSALREVWEETGCRAVLRERLGETRYRFTERREAVEVDKRVVFFLMEDSGERGAPPDGEFDRVFWCSLNEAVAGLSFESERELVRRAADRLAGDRSRSV